MSRRKGLDRALTGGIAFRRKGLEKAMTVVIILIISLAVGIVLLVMTGDNLKHFFENVDTTSDDTIDDLDCKAKCFSCCLKTPDECGIKEELLDCNCKC